MARVLTENQSGMIGYLTAVGCDKGTVFKILFNVWDEMATIEMLEFCRDNRNATPAELLKKSSEISLKYPTEEYDWEADDNSR